MNIGEALVVYTVLVLAVFRPDFRKFLLWSVAVGVALGVLAGGIWWARTAYKSHVEQVATAKHRAAVDACIKVTPARESRPSRLSGVICFGC